MPVDETTLTLDREQEERCCPARQTSSALALGRVRRCRWQLTLRGGWICLLSLEGGVGPAMRCLLA